MFWLKNSGRANERKQKIKKLINEEGIKSRLFIGKNERNEYGYLWLTQRGKPGFRFIWMKMESLKFNQQIQMATQKIY
jgi:hypothetical protein